MQTVLLTSLLMQMLLLVTTELTWRNNFAVEIFLQISGKTFLICTFSDTWRQTQRSFYLTFFCHAFSQVFRSVYEVHGSYDFVLEFVVLCPGTP